MERPRTAERVEFEMAFEARVGALKRGRRMAAVVAARAELWSELVIGLKVE